MEKYREIVTKAVIAKGRKAFTSTHIVAPEKPADKVLGCWIINHAVEACLEGGEIVLHGSFDIHIWYACNGSQSTAVLQRTMTYIEPLPVKIKEGEEIGDTTQLKVTCLRYPTCNDLKLIDESHISVTVEKELAFDGIGDAILKVQISDTFEDDFELDQEIDQSINVNYFKRPQ